MERERTHQKCHELKSNPALSCRSGCFFLLSPAFADDALELQRVIELQQKQLEKQQGQIDAQQQQLAEQRNMLLEMQRKIH